LVDVLQRSAALQGHLTLYRQRYLKMGQCRADVSGFNFDAGEFQRNTGVESPLGVSQTRVEKKSPTCAAGVNTRE
jgi:hypothetical protein